jgi:hypothetical protein
MLDLEVPSGFVHIQNILSSLLPFLSILLELISSSSSVSNVSFQVLLDLPLESKSVV